MYGCSSSHRLTFIRIRQGGALVQESFRSLTLNQTPLFAINVELFGVGAWSASSCRVTRIHPRRVEGWERIKRSTKGVKKQKDLPHLDCLLCWTNSHSLLWRNTELSSEQSMQLFWHSQRHKGREVVGWVIGAIGVQQKCNADLRLVMNKRPLCKSNYKQCVCVCVPGWLQKCNIFPSLSLKQEVTEHGALYSRDTFSSQIFLLGVWKLLCSNCLKNIWRFFLSSTAMHGLFHPHLAPSKKQASEWWKLMFSTIHFEWQQTLFKGHTKETI